jgi:hypothetical protein
VERAGATAHPVAWPIVVVGPTARRVAAPGRVVAQVCDDRGHSLAARSRFPIGDAQQRWAEFGEGELDPSWVSGAGMLPTSRVRRVSMCPANGFIYAPFSGAA